MLFLGKKNRLNPTFSFSRREEGTDSDQDSQVPPAEPLPYLRRRGQRAGPGQGQGRQVHSPPQQVQAGHQEREGKEERRRRGSKP